MDNESFGKEVQRTNFDDGSLGKANVRIVDIESHFDFMQRVSSRIRSDAQDFSDFYTVERNIRRDH